MRHWLTALGLTILAAGQVSAQNYRDLTFVRNRPSPWVSVLDLQAGLLANHADNKDAAAGLEDTRALDGHAYLRKSHFGGRDAIAEVYAGRDGAYVGLKDDVFVGKDTSSRLEISGRYFPFYREGFYQGNNFVPTGRYEGADYGIGLSFSKALAENLRLEVGPFYRHYEFRRNGTTAANYVIPDDFNGYGAKVWAEQSTLTLDRKTGRPAEGYLLTVGLEREQNDSGRTFGVLGVFESKLPSGVWRARGHLDWYLGESDLGVWEIGLDGSYSADNDRVYNYDAQKPLGNLWADGELRYRLELGDSIMVTPFVEGQFLRIADENGVGADKKIFWGGGMNLTIEFSSNIIALARYSWLSNESRPPVSAVKDTFGEHRLFVGMELRFGEAR